MLPMHLDFISSELLVNLGAGSHCRNLEERQQAQSQSAHALRFTSCVTLCKSPNVSGPLCLCFTNEDEER